MKKDENGELPIRSFLRELHHRIEANERGRISQASMASRLGISSRTYLEYLRGTNSPIGMRVVIDLLCMLDDQEVAQIVRHWRETRDCNQREVHE